MEDDVFEDEREGDESHDAENMAPSSKFVKRFEDYQSTFSQSRALQLRDIQYYYGDQLSSTTKAQLDERDQPDIVINRLRAAINGSVGVIARTPTDPIAKPRTPMMVDQGSADVATQALKYAADKARFDYLRPQCFRDFALPGQTAMLIGVDKDKNVDLVRIRWEEYFCDPRSRNEDRSDKRYDGIAKWMYAADLARKYPQYKNQIMAAAESVAGTTSSAVDNTFEDRPESNLIWVDKKTKRVFVVEMYYKERGTWYRCVFIHGGVLEKGESPYLDDKNRPINPIESVACYVDHQNYVQGLARDMIGPQDEINKRRQKLLHLASTSQIEAADPGAIEVDADEARLEAAKPDGVIPLGWKRVRTTDMSSAQFQLLQESKSEIERMGPNPAMLGRQGSDTSGRALLARQQAGMVEMALPLSQFEDWEVRVYRQMWFRMRQFWDEPQFIRITGDPEDEQFITVNEPIVGTQPALDPETGMVYPEQVILGYKNDIAEMDVDIIIDTNPETATIMQEMFNSLMELVHKNPSYQNQIPFEIFLDLMPIPRKHEVKKRLAKHKEAVAEQEAPAKEEARRVALEKHAADMEETEAKTEETRSRSVANLAQAEQSEANAESMLSTASKTAIESYLALANPSGAGEQ